MDSTSIDEDLVEEREELIVSNSQPIIKKSHFLKPCVSSIEGFEGMLRPAPSPDLKVSSLCLSFSGWRLPNRNFKFWVKKMAALHKPTWLKSGIFEAIQASTYKIVKNPSLILSLAQKWCPETNSFVFPWGEATITLEDVNVLLGFSVLGSSVFAPLESSEMKEAIEKLEKRKQESMREVSWISSFVDDELEHEAFLVLWLSKFVFPKSRHSISSNVFSIAVRLARGERIALAPAVLASIYRELSQICALESTQNVYLDSLFKLVQIWIWERFKSIRPEAKVIPRGKHRIARWSGLSQRFENVGQIVLDDFIWRPYIEPLKNWNPPRFYLEEAKLVRIDESLNGDNNAEFISFARCVRVSKLVGIGLVENYNPHRVAMQFGLAQDLPDLVTNHSSNFTEKEAWDDYNKSLDGLKLYIPSRLDTASVAARYQDWWMKTVSEMRKEPTQIFNVNSTVDHYDDSDDDVPLKIVPLSQVLQRLGGDGINKAEHLTYKKRKLACVDDDDDSAMEDDDITTAQMFKSRKKCGDEENTEGERSKLELDNNVLDLPQKLTETVATEETEQKIDENNNLAPLVASNGVAEKEEDYVIDYERLKQRKLAIEELALNLEARILKVEKTLVKIKQWRIRRNHTKIHVAA
ncbi:putative serinePthreonine-protein phosphatase 7 long form [Cardamine amara subsp. amara]|uniref:SerinePthreonine-protein phosphatase 7 long form n=1 Tax=Cardamine amara subsp. amara TaxID=228776 RepID=A0ABD0ZCQ1_CARAN